MALNLEFAVKAMMDHTSPKYLYLVLHVWKFFSQHNTLLAHIALPHKTRTIQKVQEKHISRWIKTQPPWLLIFQISTPRFGCPAPINATESCIDKHCIPVWKFKVHHFDCTRHSHGTFCNSVRINLRILAKLRLRPLHAVYPKITIEFQLEKVFFTSWQITAKCCSVSS